MPLHDLQCEDGHIFETFLPAAMLGGAQEALRFTCYCGRRAQIVYLKPPVVFGDLPGYQSPVDGRWIEGRKARREDLERHNCVPYEPSMKKEHMKRIRASDDKLGRDVERHFDSGVSAMPARKRELLEQELRSGAEVQFTRQTA